MSRLLKVRLLPVIALLAVPLFMLAPRTSAQTTPELTWTLGSEANSYVISGSGFTPGMVIDLIEIPCAELPCPSGGLMRVSEIPVSSQGTFTATMVTRSAGPPDGGLQSSDYRIIVATEHGVAWDVGTPHVRVSPITHPGVPKPPEVGNSPAEATLPDGTVAAFVGALAAMLAGGFLLARAR